jgi:hypothetical protein
MSRFKVLALAAMLALGSLSFATEVSAHGGHGGGHWGGGHWDGGHWGGHFGGFGFHRGFGFRGSYYGYYPYDGCWRWHRVWTPYGWRPHRINGCYYSYY